LPSKSTTTPITDDAVRTRAYLLSEADGHPWGRDEHYWNLAFAELSAAPAPAKAKRSLAAAAPAEKKAKAAPAVVKPVKAAAKALKSAAAKVLKAPSKAKKPKA
jgi:hypothetical protein